MVGISERRHIVRSWAGQGTAETIYQDNKGMTYREISAGEARVVLASTAGCVYCIDRDGNVKNC